jgi:hypothetical protein
MKILTKENATELLGGNPLDGFITQLSTELQLVEGSYTAPVNSGVQIALSKLFAYLVFRDSPVCLYVTCWGIATEHLDLFDGYRRSLGEKRPLIQAPVHLFERTDENAFISILCIVFFFSWDASIFDLTGRLLVQTSHDGWLDVRTNDKRLAKDVAVELESYRVALLAR